MDQIEERLLEEVADLHGVPEGAYNIRANGQMAGRNTTANIDITQRRTSRELTSVLRRVQSMRACIFRWY